MERDEAVKDCCLLEGGRWMKDGVVGEEMKGGRGGEDYLRSLV